MSTPERLSAAGLRALLGTYRDLLHQHSARLNRLNVYPVPDGDTGTNMSRTLDAAVDAMAEVAESDDGAADEMTAICDAIAHGSLMGARGNSGVILSQILRGIATTMKAHPTGDAAAFATALRAASDGADRAVLKPIEGTILSVARAAADAAEAVDGSSLSQVIEAAHHASGEALERTPEQLPVLAEAGVVDAGGAGFVLLLDAARYVVDGVALPVADDEAEHALVGEHFDAVAHRHADGDELDVSEFRYEVMYLLDLVDDRIDEFKSAWGAIGDSIVVVGGDGLWNCHIHTNEIGASIESVLDLGGRPRQIRVTDLFEEVDEEHAKREAELLDASPTHTSADWGQAGAGLPPVTTAVVAVCVGDGLVELFGQLGVQGVVTGGQTMNPSTQELLDTVEHVNADQVVILPNNSNIIPVAEQVDALTTKRVAVVPTRTMPQALAALVVYDPEATIDAVEAGMVEAIAGVRSGEITQAVRGTTTSVGEVAIGDWIGLIDREGVVAASAELSSTVVGLLERVVDDEVELVTVITGSDADTATTELITTWLDDRRADVAVEVQHGGQPLYPYLVGAE